MEVAAVELNPIGRDKREEVRGSLRIETWSILILGPLLDEPELVSLEGGGTVARLAVNRRMKDIDEGEGVEKEGCHGYCYSLYYGSH